MCGKLIHLVILVSALVPADSAFAAEDPSLVIHYSFDSIGKTVADQSGKGHDGTVQGAITPDSGGKHNGAAKFAGGHLDLDGPNFARADIPTSAITLAAWVKCDYTGRHHAIFDARTNVGTWIIHPELRADGRFRWALRAAGMSVIFDIQAGSVEWGQWLHYAATYEKMSGKAVLYINGQAISQLELPRGMDMGGDWGDGARVGLSVGNARAFTGLMDDFYLFKRAISSGEIKKIMYGPGWPYASSPSPSDGATHAATSVRLDWSAGQSAVSHDVYMGEVFEDVNDGTAGTFFSNQTLTSFVAGLAQYPAYPQGLVPGTTYYWRIDEVQANGTIHKGDVWSFRIPPSTAYDPEPADGAKFIRTDVKLGWTKALGAVLQSVYFGQSLDDVDNATTGRIQPATATTYSPGTLEPGKKYYWRVDERNTAGWQKGKVWSFTTAGTAGGLHGDYYVGIDLKDLALSRTDPQINFNWSLSGPDPKVGNDNFSTRWTGELDAPISETYSFYPTVQGGVRLWVDGRLLLDKWQDYGIDERWQEHYPVEYFSAIDLEAGSHSVVMEFAYRQSFGGGAVVQLAWGSPSMPKQIIPQAAFSLPVRANRPTPSNEQIDTRQTLTLGWSPGQYASSHQVYFGADEEAVRDAGTSSPEYKGNKPLGSESFDPGELAWDMTYYWRVDEVNTLHPESPWRGSLWSFRTADFLIVDDFELYNDLDPGDPASNRIFLTWLDGYGTTTNGAVIGYESPNWAAGEHFVETNIVHGGRQSMPFFYNNNFQYSQADLRLDPVQDWTKHGVKTLSLWFRGRADNASERIYIVVNDSAVVYHSDPDAAKKGVWTLWNIDLQEFADRGVNLASVRAIAIGFGTKGNIAAPGGSGMVLFDDIRLYPPPEQAP